MKKTLLLAALLPLTGMAAETGDTTFVVNNKKIVVNDSAGSTKYLSTAATARSLTAHTRLTLLTDRRLSAYM